VTGLAAAFLVAQLLFGSEGDPDPVPLTDEIALFILTLPIWLVGAKLFGLYDRDEERADHSTVDDLVRVFLLVTVGVFAITRLAYFTELADPDVTKATVFWALAIVSMSAARVGARTLGRRHSAYVQNTVVVGAGDVGQLIARKLLQHREYGINLLGFVDAEPRDLRPDLNGLAILGTPAELDEIVASLCVDRVVFAFSHAPHAESLERVRSLRDSGVQVDLVPRLFEVIGPKIEVHTVEGVPLVGLPPVSIPRSSRVLKRSLDVVGAWIGLVLTAPLFAVVALLIKRDSPGPVFFTQTRLGKDMREFTLLKFRTMRVDVDDTPHREFIAGTMSASAPACASGLYKLERADAVTTVGRWLRRTSLDELPQLINVLRGDMSLVGPRPCLRYETEHFAPHHFDRFLVPAGVTGLWQVSARAHSTFGEALDLDVLYAHSWSLGLDLSLLARTPLQLLRSGATA
jgi:exopolysaccharide biosynthesis polyprenyl glycosylphosphotransferase